MSTTDTHTDIDHDKLVTESLLPQLRTAMDTYSHAPDRDEEELAARDITRLKGEIEVALKHCSGEVIQLCAQMGLYADGEPINVGQRDLSR